MVRQGGVWLAVALVAAVTFASPTVAVAAGLGADHIATNLQTQIDSEPRAQYHVSIREIGGAERSIDIGGHDVREPASAIKPFFAWLALERVDHGILRLGARVSPGISWRTCITLMIEVSDNYCAADVRTALGDDWINRRLDAEGFDDTAIELDDTGNYVGKHTSTSDLAELFIRLHSGTLLSESSTDFLRGLLRNQVWRTRIHAGVPAGTLVEGKPGILAIASGTVNSDVAIVYAASTTYVIAVIGDHDATRRGVARIARIAHEGLTGESGYPGAVYPGPQFVVRSGAGLSRRIGGAAPTRINGPRAAALHHTVRNRAYVTVTGYGSGWVNWSDLHLSDAYRWLG